jgi:hypothetical protein
VAVKKEMCSGNQKALLTQGQPEQFARSPSCSWRIALVSGAIRADGRAAERTWQAWMILVGGSKGTMPPSSLSNTISGPRQKARAAESEGRHEHAHALIRTIFF